VSVQAGIWNFDGRPVDRRLLDGFSEALKEQGPDGEFCRVDGPVALLYRPFHTTAESRHEKQPYVSHRGFVITWDGRVDNREELAFDLGHDVTTDDTDVALLAAAFDRWESECFRRIIGDWAVSIWKPQQRELIFACDFMAVRHIFYYLKHDCIWWATDLAPLVLLSGNKFHIDDEYIAGYFAHAPDAHLTPYREIRQVPPGQFVRVRIDRAHVERFWRFSPKSRIRYKRDAEYEEHFRYVFRESVRRRLRSDSPILAELSGGLDSSSIVCMADDILAKGEAPAPTLDTLSYFDNTEPDGDDWIYFQKVESYRGRTGTRIDLSKLATHRPRRTAAFSALPEGLASSWTLESERAQVIRSGRYRAVLSGIGGDEFLGGIPNPSAQLADLLIQGRLFTLTEELIAWSLAKRKPSTHLLWQATTELLPAFIAQHIDTHAKAEPWINKAFARRSKLACRLLGPDEHFGFWLPTRRSYIAGVLSMANKLAKDTSPSGQIEQRQYPYLDQHLLEFIFSIPANQLLRPGERRSLMRRSLSGIVPREILSRKTKQFAARTPVLTLEHVLPELLTTFAQSLSTQFGYIDQSRFLSAIHAARAGRAIHTVRLLKTISLETWLRDLVSRELISVPSAVHDAPARSATLTWQHLDVGPSATNMSSITRERR
jgi:asparagine synthase (glutamine-hydrolysing)